MITIFFIAIVGNMVAFWYITKISNSMDKLVGDNGIVGPSGPHGPSGSQGSPTTTAPLKRGDEGPDGPKGPRGFALFNARCHGHPNNCVPTL